MSIIYRYPFLFSLTPLPLFSNPNTSTPSQPRAHVISLSHIFTPLFYLRRTYEYRPPLLYTPQTLLSPLPSSPSASWERICFVNRSDAPKQVRSRICRLGKQSKITRTLSKLNTPNENILTWEMEWRLRWNGLPFALSVHTTVACNHSESRYFYRLRRLTDQCPYYISS